MNNTEKLLPCPFCGQQPTEYAIEPHTHVLQFAGGKMADHQGSYVIECTCGCGMIEATREEVVAVWNHRPAQCLHQIQEPSAAEQAAWHAGLDEGRAQAAPAAVAEYGSREERMVVLQRGHDGIPTVWCDPEIADIVGALNSGGVKTVASCSGHGEKPGGIALADGRQLLLLNSLDAFNSAISTLCPSASAPEAVAVDQRWCPDVCPITGRKFFMWITHHDTGDDVPTYGGPFDSYTIPVKNEDGSYSCERYDHDFGGWREWEDVGLSIVDNQSFVVEPDNQRYDEIRDFAKGRAALAAAPAADAEPVAAKADPLDALRWGANVAETLLSIGRAIGFGRAQQILGEQWEAEHNCAPRGRMGVTVKDDDQSAFTATPVTLPEPATWTLQSELDAKRTTTNGHLWFSNPVNAMWTALYTEQQVRALLATATELPAQAFQQRVQPWMMACFGSEISADRRERNHRFLEEALETVQCLGCTASEAHQLVDYVYGRPWGEPAQEVGGVMVTLAALCLANGLDMHAAGDTELARIWTMVEAIRAKQAAKPKHSPLPMHAPQAQADAQDAVAFKAAIEKLPRYTYGFKSDDWGMGSHLQSYQDPEGKFLNREEVIAAIAAAKGEAQ